MRTLACQVIADDLIVCVAGECPWSDADWAEFMSQLQALLPKLPSSKPLRTLFFTGEHGPSAKQRSEAAQILRGVEQVNATITVSTIAKYIITAFAWLGMPMKAFAPEQVTSALLYLDLTHDGVEQALSCAATLARSVGGSRCVERAAQRLARA